MVSPAGVFSKGHTRGRPWEVRGILYHKGHQGSHNRDLYLLMSLQIVIQWMCTRDTCSHKGEAETLLSWSCLNSWQKNVVYRKVKKIKECINFITSPVLCSPAWPVPTRDMPNISDLPCKLTSSWCLSSPLPILLLIIWDHMDHLRIK